MSTVAAPPHLWLSAGAAPPGFYSDDALYLLISLAVLVLLSPERPTHPAWMAACVIAGPALLTRTVAVALGAVILSAALRQRPSRPWLLLLVLLAPGQCLHAGRPSYLPAPRMQRIRRPAAMFTQPPRWTEPS